MQGPTRGDGEGPDHRADLEGVAVPGAEMAHTRVVDGEVEVVPAEEVPVEPSQGEPLEPDLAGEVDAQGLVAEERVDLSGLPIAVADDPEAVRGLRDQGVALHVRRARRDRHPVALDGGDGGALGPEAVGGGRGHAGRCGQRQRGQRNLQSTHRFPFSENTSRRLSILFGLLSMRVMQRIRQFDKTLSRAQ